MAGPSSAYTLVAEDPDDPTANLSVQDLRSALQKASDEAKLQILRSIVTATLNGRDLVGGLLSFSVSLSVPVAAWRKSRPTERARESSMLCLD